MLRKRLKRHQNKLVQINKKIRMKILKVNRSLNQPRKNKELKMVLINRNKKMKMMEKTHLELVVKKERTSSMRILAKREKMISRSMGMMI